VEAFADRERATPRAFALPGSIALWLGGLVALSAVVRTAAAWLRSTPNYYVDEYLYASLGRSLASTGHATVRGVPAHFPALLQPLLAAPGWLVHDTAASYRTVQALDAFYMSLAAIPVYLIARRLLLSREVSLVVAALAVAVPDLVYASMTLSEPVAYPLALASVAAALAALEQPRARTQLLFFALAGLTAFARVQFAVLPACYVVAVAVIAIREGRIRRRLWEHRLALALVAAGGALLVAHGLRSNLGYYPGFLNVHVDVAHAIRIAGKNAYVLLYASGWVLVPGAVLGAALAVVRPRFRAELAFAAFTAPLALALLAQASLYGANYATQERYLFYVLPLAALAFALYASRGWPFRLAHAAVAAALAALAALEPLSGLASTGNNAHSPFLWAVGRISAATGNYGQSALIVAAVATGLSLVVVVASARPRLATPLALAIALAAVAAASAAAVSYDRDNVAKLRAAFLPADRSWVDDAHVGRVALLAGPHGSKTNVLDQLFWNRSIDRVLLLPQTEPADPFAATRASVDVDGTITGDGRPVTGPMLVDEFGMTARLRDASLVRRTRTMSLWRPHGRARLRLMMLERYYDGWLGPLGALVVWPDRAGGMLTGRLSFRVTAPAATPFTIRVGHSVIYRAKLAAGKTRTVSVPVCGRGVWAAGFEAYATGVVNLRTVSVRSTAPSFAPDRDACP
jgi:hypothetical protein